MRVEILRVERPAERPYDLVISALVGPAPADGEEDKRQPVTIVTPAGELEGGTPAQRRRRAAELVGERYQAGQNTDLGIAGAVEV